MSQKYNILIILFSLKKFKYFNTFFAVDLWISNVIRRTRALCVPVDDSALGIESANSVLQTGVRATTLLAASLVGLAIVVSVALQLYALLSGFALVALGAQANRSVSRNFAQGTNSTSSSVKTWVSALAIRA